jgi:hypothetical protein
MTNVKNEEMDNWEDMDTNGRITVKWSLEKCVGRVGLSDSGQRSEAVYF